MVSSDSDCETEPQTSSDASLENGTANIPGKQPMLFGLFGMLPETVEVTDLRLLSVIDGTPDFDADDAPGHDSSDNNGILRTLDTVTYNLRMAIQEPEDPTREGETDVVQFMAIIPDVEKDSVHFMTDSMGWLEDAEVGYEDENLILTGSVKVDSAEKDAFWQDLSVSMRAYNMDQGEIFAPEFYAWIDGQETAASVEEGTEINVSAKEAVNIKLQFDNVGTKGIWDFSMDPANTEDVFGYMFGLTLNVELLSDRNDLKGVRFPDEDITFDIAMNVFDTEGNLKTPQDTEEGLYVSRLWDYHQALTGDEKTGTLRRELEGQITGRTLMPHGVYNEEHPESCVYDSGDLLVTQENNVLHVTIKNYEFAPEIHFPEYTQYGNVYNQRSNSGVFSTAFFQILVPYEDVTGSTLYTVEAEAENVKLAGNAVVQNNVKDDVTTRQIQTIIGTWNQYIAFTHKDEFVDTDSTVTVGALGRAGTRQGNHYAYPGEELYMIPTTALYTDGLTYNGVDYLVKVADAIELPDISDIKSYYVYPKSYGDDVTYSKAENPFDMMKSRYAAKADGSYWASEEEMDDAQIEDLVYYDSKEAAEKAGAEILGLFFQARDGKEVADRYRLMFVVPVKISDDAELNYVYPAYHETTGYCINTADSEEGMTFEVGVEHLDETDNMNSRVKDLYGLFCSRYGNTKQVAGRYYTRDHAGMMYYINHKYVKSVYIDGQVQPGTHIAIEEDGKMTGQFGGASLLIVGTYASIEKDIEQQDESGNSRSVYNLNANQREVDFVLRPSYQFAVEHLLKEEVNTLVITDTLDKGLTYLEGSAYQGGTYDTESESLTGGTALEPTVSVNAEGCQVLTWTLADMKAGESIAPIHYSCIIGAQGTADDVKNGDMLSGTVTITASSDHRPVTAETGKVAVASLQVVMGKGSALDKTVDKLYAELADNVTYTVEFENNGNMDYADIIVRDILPYEGDGRGTDFKGAEYSVESVKLATGSNADAKIFVTTMKPESIASLEAMYADEQAWSGWTELADGMSLDGITAIALRGDVPAGQTLAAVVELAIDCPVTRAVFANSVEAYTSDHQKLTSLKVRTTVLPRKVSGLTWFDTDRDGIRENGEKLLAGVKVTLLDAAGNIVNDIYGNPVAAVVTGADGAYSFDNLAAGEYQICFESDSYDLDNLLVSLKDSAAAGDELDSDADAVVEGETLKAAVISGIELPELDEIVEKKLDEWHEANLDAGFHEPESEETEPETNPSEPETTPSHRDDDDDDEPETTKKPTEPTTPTEATPQETTTDAITDTVPEPTPLPYVDPEARPEDIPEDVINEYYERFTKGEIDLNDIPFGVLGAFYEKGLLAEAPHTGDFGGFWTLMMLISMIGLAVTSMIDRKRVRK